MLSTWDPNVFSKINVFPFEYYLIVEGTVFNPSSANVFNNFIRDANLWDIPLGGHLFTRTNKHGDKLSKLDRFLLSDCLFSILQNHTGLVLDCHILNHRPILLSPSNIDFGPTPFKFFNSWLLDAQLHTIVTKFWDQHTPAIQSTNPIVAFKNKMKDLKFVIKAWSSNRNNTQYREKEDLIKNIKDFDDKIATRSDLTPDAPHRSSWIDKLRDIESKENQDFAQKAKIKWGIEADENSKFFHAMVNKKPRYLTIQGIKLDGQWIEDPIRIKDAFLTFYEKKFQKIDVAKVISRSTFYKSLFEEQNSYLVSSCYESEIKEAIWDCGSDKSPILDGFTFAFYKKYWDTIKRDIVEFINHFLSSGFLPRGCNTSFIALIPKVPNPLVISDFHDALFIGDWSISDHMPILLSPSNIDFGPTPFKFFNSWLLDAQLHCYRVLDQHTPAIQSTNLIVAFKNKMKDLKFVIKAWSSNRNNTQYREKEDLIKNIKDFDENIIPRP
nr:RNA-directed DNA polymerase, eukaryota [Tanacetum cinerariifolium]